MKRYSGNNHRKNRVKSYFLSLGSVLLFLNCTIAADRPPNILIITVDNLGYGDLRSYQPNSEIITPHIDKIAAQGARLTGFYTASPTCTVSRGALLTGRIPQRNKLEEQLAGIPGNYGVGLRPSEILIPGILKTSAHNYATGCFGKWNIGFAPGSRPTERGFDEYLGHASGNIDYYTHVYQGKHDLFENTEEVFRDGAYSTDLFADAAIRFIKKNSSDNKPWFVYLPFNAPHFPSPGNQRPGEEPEWQAPDWAFHTYGLSPGEKDKKRRYHAVVTALDSAIGRVIQTLESLNISENTFVFLCSDNGAFMLPERGLEVSSNLPLRSGGVTCWEGGLRVAAFAVWPGKIKAGSIISTPLWSPDILQACARLSEAKLPDNVVFDGKDPIPVLTGKITESPHESFYFKYQDQAAFRFKNWKIVREKTSSAWSLFDLNSDISEAEDLAKLYPEKVEAMAKMFSLKSEELSGSR